MSPPQSTTQTIVVNARDSAHVQVDVNGDLLVSYHIPRALQFTEPHFARLLWLQPHPKIPVFVYADFLKPQIVNDGYAPFLGTSGSTAISSWIPLASNYLSSFGFFRLAHINKAKTWTEDKNFTIVVELASQAWVNGTSGQAGL